MFLLVHPAWFGGWCWRKIRPHLAQDGAKVWTPTLTGLGERAHLASPEISLSTHIEDIVNVIVCEELNNIVLVGHSSSGLVITGVADRLPERIVRLIYLDAFVPEDGQALRDMIPAERWAGMEALAAKEGQGWRLPRLIDLPWDTILKERFEIVDDADRRWLKARLVATPLKHFTTKVKLQRPAMELPRTYIRCLRWPNPLFDHHATLAKTGPGWDYRQMDASHLPFVTHPEELAALLLATI